MSEDTGVVGDGIVVGEHLLDGIAHGLVGHDDPVADVADVCIIPPLMEVKDAGSRDQIFI